MKMIPSIVILTAALAAAALLSAKSEEATPAPRFTGLGDLRGGMFHSVAKAVSADGAVVVGYGSSAAGMEAFRWTQTDGMSGLGFPHALDISADGSVVVGYRLVGGRGEPVRWTVQGGAETLDARADLRNGAAYGISADGTTIVGVVGVKERDSGERDRAFRWTPRGQIAHFAQHADAGIHSEAHAVSADGAVVVGASRHRTGHDEAFRWTAEAGLVRLGFLPGHSTSLAYGTSADGSVVVGRSSDFAITEAFRWTQETGMISLGALPGGSGDSSAYGVSADGSVIVGYCAGTRGREAFVWDADHGMRAIHDALVRELRLADDMRGWRLSSAMAISADGTTIVGVGRNRRGDNEAWLARLGTGRSAAAGVRSIGSNRTASRR